MVLQPRIRRNALGLGSSRFDRHYSGNRSFLSFPAGTKMFQFPAFAPSIDGTWSSTMWVPPFGHLRINSCLQIPGAFRSLPRPSSLSEAKASSVRSCSLSLCESQDDFVSCILVLPLKLQSLTTRKNSNLFTDYNLFFTSLSLSVLSMN